MDCETYIVKNMLKYIVGVNLRMLFGCHCVFWSLCYIVCLHACIMLRVSVYTQHLLHTVVVLVEEWA